MRPLALLVSVFAVRVLGPSWRELQAQLITTYCEYLSAGDYRPSTLAQQLLISGEDHRFFRHGGIDLIATCRAIWRGAILGRPEGASTIEMQVVRVVSGRFERTVLRKLREMALATLVVRQIPKADLPGVYLWIGYFGWRMNGYRAACQRLGIRPDTMTTFQTAQLVARLKYPQPQAMRGKRKDQINVRARHLLRLYLQHKRDRTYAGL